LCFWEDERAWQGVAYEAGPWAIEEYLQSSLDCRFIQSFKSVAASPLFERTLIYKRPYGFEDHAFSGAFEMRRTILVVRSPPKESRTSPVQSSFG